MDSVSILGPVAPSPTTIPFFLPTVPAGFPSPAQDHIEQRVSLDELFQLHRPQIYLAQVSGHSLTGLGILDGDLVLIDKALQPRREDVVIACLNGDPLIKIFDIEGEPAELGKNRTLRFSELPQRPEFPVFQLAALPPNVIAGQVDVLPAQWRKVLQ